ncbi:MAG: ABC transporter permease [Burkholderiaceae bacterium]
MNPQAPERPTHRVHGNGGGFAQRILAIAAKELRHLRRDRLTGGLIAGIPLIMTLLFGYAIDQDIRHLSGAVVDLAGNQSSRALVQAIEATQVVDIVASEPSVEQLQQRLIRGELSLGIVIAADIERRLRHGDQPLAQLMVDGSDPLVLSSARALMNMPRAAFASPIVSAQTSFEPPFALRAWFNPERRSAVFIVPALTAVILTLTMVLFTSIAIVRERERGNLELLINTPVRTLELMLGKILPYIAIGYLQITLILLLGTTLFHVTIVGSLWDFYLAAGVFVLAVLTLGLVISTLASSQFQAFQMTFMTFLPQLLLSGYMFPFEGMPKPAQWLAEIFPMTHFLRVVRGIILRGADLADMLPQMWPLLAFFVIGISIATLRFRKRLD